MSPCCHGNLCFERVIENVIKYDLYVTFPRIFAYNVQIQAKYVVKISVMSAEYFEYYTIILGPFFRGHAVYMKRVKLCDLYDSVLYVVGLCLVRACCRWISLKISLH